MSDRLTNFSHPLAVLFDIGLADFQFERRKGIASDRLLRERDQLVDRTVQPAHVSVVQAHTIERSAQQLIQRRAGSHAGEIPERDVDGGQRRRTDAAGCQRVDAFRQAPHQRDDGTRILVEHCRQQRILQQRQNSRAAAADGVAEPAPAAAGAIGQLHDGELERGKLLDGIAARRVNGDSDQTRLSTHNVGSTIVHVCRRRSPRPRCRFMLCNDRAAPARQSLG